MRFVQSIFKVLFTVVTIFNELLHSNLIKLDFDPNHEIWMGFQWFVLSYGGGVKMLTPCLKVVKLCQKYEICNVSTHRTQVVSENTSFSTNAALNLLMSAFFCKKSAFFDKNSTFTQSSSVRAVLEIFQFCFQFL